MAAIQPITNFTFDNGNFSNAELSTMFRLVQSSEVETVTLDGITCEIEVETLTPAYRIEDKLNAYDVGLIQKQQMEAMDKVRPGVTTHKPGSDRVADLAKWYAENEGTSAFDISDEEVSSNMAMYLTEDMID